MRNKLILLLALCLISTPAFAAITFKEPMSGGCDDCDSKTVNSEITTCSNQILIAAVGIEEIGDGDNEANSVTWNGNGMTKIGCDVFWNGETSCLYYLLDPDDGTYDLIATFDGSSSVDIVLGAVVMCGAKQQAAEATCNGEDSCDITTVTANAALISIITSAVNDSHVVAGSLDTEHYETSPPAWGMDSALGSVTDAGVAGSKTCGWTNSETGNRSGTFCAAFEEATAPAGRTRRVF